MRIVFMGTPRFAAPSLEKLLGSSHEVAAVVTQPDKPAGRGRKLETPPVKEVALNAGLPVLQPEKPRGKAFLRELQGFGADVLAVVAYGHILRPEVLAAPRLGAVNLHASLLPKYRGAGPIQWALINGERATGATIIKLDEGMDSGEILAQERVEILEDDNARSLGDMLSVVGAELLVRALDEAEAKGELSGKAQVEAEATFAPMLKKEDGRLDWTAAPERIVNRIRGVTPWPGAFSGLGGEAWRILRAEGIREDQFPPSPVEKPQPGMIIGVAKGRGVVVRTGAGPILISRVQPPGKREMGAADCVNGGLLKVGMRFE